MEKKRILIADDERALGLLLMSALNKGDYELDVVENGVEAISHMEIKPYDLVISDYMMPKMDGLELTKRIRSKYGSTPILIVTGNGPVNDLLESGATACIEKPFSLLEIKNIVRALLTIDNHLSN